VKIERRREVAFSLRVRHALDTGLAASANVVAGLYALIQDASMIYWGREWSSLEVIVHGSNSQSGNKLWRYCATVRKIDLNSDSKTVESAYFSSSHGRATWYPVVDVVESRLDFRSRRQVLILALSSILQTLHGFLNQESLAILKDFISKQGLEVPKCLWTPHQLQIALGRFEFFYSICSLHR
jgi:hypothetical protein